MPSKKRRVRAKPVSVSSIEQRHSVFPHELNPRDKMFGGAVYSLEDIHAEQIFELHADGMHGVTLGHDKGRYFQPVQKGDTLVLRGSLNRAWRTSCEIGMKVFRIDYKDGKPIYVPVTRGYFTYVCDEFDEQGKRKEIPTVVPRTKEQKRRYEEAGLRRAISILLDSVPKEKQGEALRTQFETLKTFFEANGIPIPRAALESI